MRSIGNREKLRPPRRATLACAISHRQVFDEEHPELVFHAAALKHVPMVDCPDEGALTNVIGTKVSYACCAHDTLAMVLITDKAVNPQHDGRDKRRRLLPGAGPAQGARVTADLRHGRFGNVLGSTGP